MLSASFLVFLVAAAMILCLGCMEILMLTFSDSVLVILLLLIWAFIFLSFLLLWTISFILYPVMMVENKTPVASIRRSLELSEGQIYILFCAKFLYVSTQHLTTELLNDILTGSFHKLDNRMISIAVFTLFSLLFLPVQANLRVVVYMNIRVESEGLDGIMLKEQLQETGFFFFENPEEATNDMKNTGGSSTQGDYIDGGVLMEDSSEKHSKAEEHEHDDAAMKVVFIASTEEDIEQSGNQ